MAGFIIRVWITFQEPLKEIQIIPQIPQTFLHACKNIVLEWHILFGSYGGCAFGYMSGI